MEKYSEKVLEAKLRIDVKKLGGIAYKFVSPGINGVPDRIILMPNGKAFFAEIKSTGKKPTALQLFNHRQLRALGFEVFIIDDAESLVNCINAIQTT